MLMFADIGATIWQNGKPNFRDYKKIKIRISPVDLVNIDNLNAYVSLLIGGQTTRPFNIRVDTEKEFGAAEEISILFSRKTSWN